MLMSSQNNLKQQVDTVLNSLLQPFKCSGEWCCSRHNDSLFKTTDQQEYTIKSHVSGNRFSP